MATNPRIPESLDPREPSHTGGLKTPRPSSGRNGVILAIIVAVLLLGAIFYFMPRAPKATPPATAANEPQQPVAGQIQLSNVKMTPGPTGESLNIEGMVQNTGNQTINGMVALVRFKAEDGSVAGAVNQPVQAVSAQSGGRNTQGLADAPIKPNDTRPIRIGIDRVPPNWNHQMPDIQVSAVSSHP